MDSKFFTTFVAVIVAAATIWTPASAHEMQWREGVSRQVGYGHCAKGPCRMRTCWAPTRPHRHVGNEIDVNRIGPSECWSYPTWRGKRKAR